MKRGLVLGKFMPLHNGHIGLIKFALNQCDELIVLVCACANEPIEGAKRWAWVEQYFRGNMAVKPQLLIYDDTLLPNTSVSSQIVSELWAGYLRQHVLPIDIIFASEKYGEYMAQYLGCEFAIYDEGRQNTPVSSTQIRENAFKYWDYIPAFVKPFYVKKVCLYGTESTGKSTLTRLLAEHYDTVYVPEMAREVIEHTDECIEQHLNQIATLQAHAINTTLATANKLLFVDTDVNITRSYSRFLFDTELDIPQWIEEANQFSLHLYLENDAPFIQDGTRLNKDERDKLNISHKKELADRGITYTSISGGWEERYLAAIAAVDKLL